MTDSIRCPSCRGAKKMPKLGGMVGECNTCVGKGTILAVDKPKKVEVTIEDVISKELINAVSDCKQVSNVEPLPVESQVKVDPKKAIYKRKKSA